MSARCLTSHRLQLECLEGRRLPSGLADAPILAAVLESHPAAEALVARYLAHDAASRAEPNVPGAAGTGFASDAANVVRALQAAGNSSLAANPNHGFWVNDGSGSFLGRLMNDPDMHQLEQRLDGLVRNILASVATLAAPAPPPSSSTQSHFDSESKYSIRITPAAGQRAAPGARAAEEARPVTTVLQNAPDALIHEYDPARGDTIACGAPPDGPSGGGEFRDLLPPVPSLDAIATSWRDVFSIPLAGVPIAAALPTNFHALDAAAQAFFEHLADLAPDWPTESEECGYVWLVAGALLAGGGRQFVQRARSRAAAPVAHLPTAGTEGDG